MNGRVLKASERPLATVQSLAEVLAPPAVTTPPAAPVQDPELLRLRGEVEALSALGARQAQEIDRLKAAAAKAFGEGEAAGRQAGLKAAEDGRRERLAALQDAAERAIRAFTRELASLERAAPLIARQALAKMFGAEDGRRGLVIDLVKAQLDLIADQAVVRIEVSRSDFPDAEALAQLAAAVGEGLDIQTSERMRTGECRVKLALGALEVGFDQQWRALDAALEAMAAPEAGP